jgi:hypothetical protein
MKALTALLIVALVTGCTSSTPLGECVGAFDEGDPALVYKTSGWNVAMGIIFVETILVPVVVVVDETKCPVRRR